MLEKSVKNYFFQILLAYILVVYCPRNDSRRYFLSLSVAV